MIEVKVTVELAGMPEAINRLAESISGVKLPVPATVVPFPVQADSAQPVDSTTPVPAPTQTAVANTAAPVTAQAPTIAPSVVPAAQTQIPVVTTASVTLDAVTKAGAQLVDMGKMDDLIALLRKFGVAAVTMLTPEQLPAIAVELRAMGASI